MTNQQFLDFFYIQYDKVANLSAPGYTPAEISLIASEAQELLVVTNYMPKSNIIREGFEEIEKRIQDLGELVTSDIITPAPYNPLLNMPNGVFVTLPNTLISNPTDYSNVYWFTVFEEAITSMMCNNAPKRVKIIEISHQEYRQLLDDPFNRPTDSKVWRMRFENRRHELITDGTYSITGYHVRYIKKPTPIDLVTNPNAQVSQLSDHVHRELLRKTIELALKTIGDNDRLGVETKFRTE